MRARMDDVVAEQAPRTDAVKVSVVVPCFNSVATLHEAVRSVQQQTLRDFEIVLVDDGSTDATRALIARIAGAHPRVRIEPILQANAGTAAARNAGIARARGRYVLPLDADDLIAPTMLERCATLLDSDPEIDIVYCDREDFGDISAIRSAGSFAVERLKFFNQLGYCSLYRRSLWQAIGGYRTNVSGFDDWDFWIAAAVRERKAAHIPEPLFKHRRHAQSQLWRLMPAFERLHAQIILNNRAAYSEDEVAMAERYLQNGESAAMLRSAQFVFRMHYFQDYEARQMERTCG
jgi:glycosyltransferase involved in cell wall biosynthesis